MRELFRNYSQGFVEIGPIGVNGHSQGIVGQWVRWHCHYHDAPFPAEHNCRGVVDLVAAVGISIISGPFAHWQFDVAPLFLWLPKGVLRRAYFPVPADAPAFVLESLKWLGMDWDEGVEVGGPDAPYRQSERMDIYAGVVEKLLDAGFAYKSFSTPAEIDARNEAAGRPKQMGYDGFDRNFTADQIAAFEAEGREATVRIKMPDEDITFTDLVRGEITFKAGSVPDFVIVRANGQPLYTLVNPVDDALMGINCVLRGEDLLSSTPRQIALYGYLQQVGVGNGVPEFGHLPYVMGEKNKKLSKRDPESNLFLHRERGMIPEGLINYLALLGWSISADNDIFSVQELVDAFDPSDVLANPARFDLKKCTAINAEHIRLLDPADFRERLVPYLHGSVSAKLVEMDLIKQIAEADPELPTLQVYEPLVSADSWAALTPREQEILTAAAPLVQTRIQLLGEAREMLDFLLSDAETVALDDDAQKQLDKVTDWQGVLSAAIAVLEGVNESDWTTDNLHTVLETKLVGVRDADGNIIPGEGDSLNLKPRDAFTPLRVALSGRRVSPPLFESLEILGKTLSLARLSSL
jgi:glutamyl-tRNA synthetase